MQFAYLSQAITYAKETLKWFNQSFPKQTIAPYLAV
jgi:hypothetical protein